MPNVRQDNTRNKYNWPGQLLNCLSASLRFIFILFCLKAKILFISFSLVCVLSAEGKHFGKSNFIQIATLILFNFIVQGISFIFADIDWLTRDTYRANIWPHDWLHHQADISIALVALLSSIIDIRRTGRKNVETFKCLSVIRIRRVSFTFRVLFVTSPAREPRAFRILREKSHTMRRKGHGPLSIHHVRLNSKSPVIYTYGRNLFRSLLYPWNQKIK